MLLGQPDENGNTPISARDYLKKSRGISDVELSYLGYLNQYTLEAIIIHVLGSVFNSVQEKGSVRVSTLIEQLESTFRVHLIFGFSDNCSS